MTLELCQENCYKNTGLGAKWRENRLTPMQFLEKLLQAGFVLSPLIGLPAFSLSLVVLDWLHVVDLGVSADLIGNLFHEITASACLLFPGANTKEKRLNALWAKLRTWYDECKPAARLDNLTFEMFTGGKKPKLKAKGGECRYLLPFAAELACQLASKCRSVHNCTVAAMFCSLVELQRWISGDFQPYNAEAAGAVCRKVCVLYTALHEEMVASGKPLLWDLKPKVHLLQELVEFQAFELGNPRHFWCYRDESWCGFWAKVSKRRGGANSSAMTPKRFLNRFRAPETF